MADLHSIIPIKYSLHCSFIDHEKKVVAQLKIHVLIVVSRGQIMIK